MARLLWFQNPFKEMKIDENDWENLFCGALCSILSCFPGFEVVPVQYALL